MVGIHALLQDPHRNTRIEFFDAADKLIIKRRIFHDLKARLISR